MIVRWRIRAWLTLITLRGPMRGLRLRAPTRDQEQGSLKRRWRDGSLAWLLPLRARAGVMSAGLDRARRVYLLVYMCVCRRHATQR